MRLALLLVVAGTLVLAQPVLAGGGDIRPGDLVNDICTLNFVFDGPGGRVFIGTAAHCVNVVGESASTPGTADFGEVVSIRPQLDFALIEVHRAFRGSVGAEVRGHDGMPTGVATADDTSRGDVLLLSGHGMGFDFSSVTRERRFGFLMEHDETSYVADTLATWGDSGGPILHESGAALGIVSQFGFGQFPPATDEGPTMEGILADLAANGFPVTLRTA